eukprot:3093331-Pyramimonas_sp.AAC.1
MRGGTWGRMRRTAGRREGLSRPSGGFLRASWGPLDDLPGASRGSLGSSGREGGAAPGGRLGVHRD